ncbi:F-BAR domain only protein 1 isoform X3 [Oncorhynchus tshawytscha]|uniref:F-BAR domain only protein 1 isoform X3 n=1 Tax=Oncorhynchus tshawytscha TaxID=74940 RepID=UPI001C3CB5E2|nr:F-BAR domain only protein 1 isoform X3 [Oncorhynchus tshawytscha]
MAFFKNNFWGEKNAGFDVLYHNMKHGQIATKELAEFVRERAAIEETYSKSMSKLAKMASNGSPLGTFAPMWDLFRVSSDKLALCHLELMRKMNDLIRDINKYGDEQVKVHRKTKEEQVGTLDAVQAVQVQSGHLQKFREGYHAKCIELDRLRKEGAPQKELEKAEMKSKKSAESFAVCIEKYNRVGGDFEQKMSESAQKFQDIEEAHLRQMKQLIKGYSHSIEDTHVQVGQVHEEFKQNVENIGIDNLIQRFAEQKGTGKDRPALVGFEEYMTSLVPEGSKKSRGKAFRIPGLGKRDKEPDSTDSAVTETPNSPLEVDEEGFVIRADVNQNGCSMEDKEDNFYSSDSDFDDEEPKKFHIQIRPVGSSSNSAATEMELKATVGALTLPPNRGVSIKRHLSRNSSTTGRSEGEGEGATHREGEQDGLCRSTSSPDPSRLSSTASGSDSLFGPPLESAFKSKSFAGRDQLQRAESVFGASEYAAFSSDSSSPENVEDSGLDSPSHQPLGPSPEPAGWAAWPSASQNKEPAGLGRPEDSFLTVFRDPSPERSPHPQDNPASIWAAAPRSSRPPPDMDPSALCFPAFSQSLAPPELDPALWSCKHIPPEDPFLAAFERTVTQETLPPPDAWAPPRPRPSRDGRGIAVQGDPFSSSLSDSKTLPTPSSCSRKDRDRKRDRSAPPPESPDDPFAITMIGSPTHQSALAAATGILTHIVSSSRLTPNSNSLPLSHPKKELVHWNSVHNPFSEGTSAGSLALGGVVREGGRKHRESRSESEPRRSGLPLTRHSGPQEDLCFSTDKDQNCLDLNTSQPPCNMGSHKGCNIGNVPLGSKQSFRQDSAELLVAAPPRPARAKRSSGRLSGCEGSRSVCSSPQPEPSPDLTSSSSSSPSEWGAQTRAPSPARGGQPSPLSHLNQDHAPLHMHLSRGPSPISLSTQELWPVAAAITEYINAYFKGGQHNRCLVKITGDLTMSFPAGITRIFTANPNAPVLSFRLVNISRVNHFLPNQKLLYSDPSQSDPDTRDFWFNMQALNLYLQREAELNPLASYYNVALLKYQVSSQDPGRAPLLLSAECQRSGTVTRVALDYHCCPATAPSTQLTAVQVLLPLDHTATDLQCQPPASWNAEERQLLWKLPNLSPTNHSKGSGTLCASWQCLEVPRGPPPSLAVQFVGSGASLSGMDVELVGSHYRMSLVKKRFATGKYMAGCSL